MYNLLLLVTYPIVPAAGLLGKSVGLVTTVVDGVMSFEPAAVSICDEVTAPPLLVTVFISPILVNTTPTGLGVPEVALGTRAMAPVVLSTLKVAPPKSNVLPLK